MIDTLLLIYVMGMVYHVGWADGYSAGAREKLPLKVYVAFAFFWPAVLFMAIVHAFRRRG